MRRIVVLTLVAFAITAHLTSDSLGQNRAQPLAREQLQAELRAMPPELQVTILKDLTTRYYRSGDFEKGLEYANWFLKLVQENYKENDKRYIEALHNLASLLTQLGHYAQAGILREKAHALAEMYLPRGDLLRLAVANGLATYYSLMRRYKDAEPIFETLVEDCKSFLGPDDEYTLGAITNIAGLYQDTGRSERTIKLLEPLIARYREHQQQADPNAVTTSLLLASAFQKDGRPNDAVRFLSEFETINKAAHGPSHQLTLAISNSLAYSLDRAGDLDTAFPIYEKVAKGAASRFGEDHPNTLTTELSAVSVLLRKNDTDAAVQRLTRLAPLFLRWTSAELLDTSDTIGRQQLVARQSTYPDVAISVAIQTGNAGALRLAAEAILQWKQLRGAQEAVLSRFIAITTDPSVLALAKTLATLRNQLAIAFHLGDPAASRLLREAERIEFQLAEASKEFAELQRQRRVGIQDINNALGQKAGLLEFRVYRPIALDTGRPGERHLVGMILSNGGTPILHDLGLHSEIEAQVEIAAKFDDSTGRKQAVQKLATRVLAPFADSLRQLEKVYVAPDGALNLLPLESLPFGDKDYWIEAQDLRFVSTGRSLASTRQTMNDGGMVAIGAVEFDQVAPSPEVSSAPSIAPNQIELKRAADGAIRLREMQPFKPLPETGPEAHDIVDMWKRVTSRPALLLSQNDAREFKVKTLEGMPSVLHFATHGFFLTNAPGAGGSMLLSGLALAGANLAVKGIPSRDGEDGILWALEAMSLRLSGTQLVTMSACNTAQGVVDAFEGVYGLSRGFQIAGAENVLVTLWALNDMRARVFMEDFYKRWLTASNPGDPADALRATKLAWLNSPNPAKSDPRIWAPYILIQRGT